MTKANGKIPASLTACIAQSKRLTSELASVKQDLDIATNLPTQDNLYVLTSRMRMLRSQQWALEASLRNFIDAVDAQIERAKQPEEWPSVLALPAPRKAVRG